MHLINLFIIDTINFIGEPEFFIFFCFLNQRYEMFNASYSHLWGGGGGEE